MYQNQNLSLTRLRSTVYASQVTEVHIKWNATLGAFKKALQSKDPKVVASLKEINSQLYALRTIGAGTVHIPRALETLAIAYANPGMIGSRLMPYVTTPKQTDKYFELRNRDVFAFPDDRIGPRGEASEVDQNYTSSSFTCDPKGLDGFVSVEDIVNADMPLEPMADKLIAVIEGMAWNQEIRHAEILSTAGNFGGNTLAISAGDEWDSASGGDPVAVIQDAKDALLSGPNETMVIGYCSLNVYRALQRNPKIRALYNAPNGGQAPGQIPRRAIAEYFELDDLLVGEARKDIAQTVDTMSLSRIFPDVFGIVRVATSPSRRSLHFGSTFDWRAPEFAPVRTIYEPKKGMGGGYTIMARRAVDEKVVAPLAGYLITGCLSS